ncbi:MAG: hypothetical protein AYK18_01180 [Theionarchaea archaeon DG-70]|nr:MAG: hypothetical protein AYK18_01180 [Theionarchaea archaeon DG-70]
MGKQLSVCMELPSDIQELSQYCQSVYLTAETVIHRWGHIIRTANGAAWVVKALGGTKREQQLAYVAGILHDSVRPLTEQICHAQASAENALHILSTYSAFTDVEKQEIYLAIKDHRNPVTWKTSVHQSVYLSDKILEHMGAYLDFRAPVWTGELSHTDFQGLEPVEAVIQYYNNVSQKFLIGQFPKFVEDLVLYQTSWNKKYLKTLKNGDSWAVNMAETLYYAGSRKEDFDQTLLSFQPEGDFQKKWTHEMREYIAGKKFPYFQDLLRL